MKPIEIQVELRRKNQMTWPGQIVAAMGAAAGERLIVEYDPETGVASVRRVPKSFAGTLAGVYGRTSDEVAAYVDKERTSWAEPG